MQLNELVEREQKTLLRVHVIRTTCLRSVEIYIFIFRPCSVREQIVVHFDFFLLLLHIFLTIAHVVVLSIACSILSCLRLFVFFENNVLDTIVGVVEKVGIDLEEGTTRDEIHVSFVGFALGFLSCDSLF